MLMILTYLCICNQLKTIAIVKAKFSKRMHYSSIYSFISGSLLAFCPTVHCQFFLKNYLHAYERHVIHKLPVFSHFHQVPQQLSWQSVQLWTGRSPVQFPALATFIFFVIGKEIKVSQSLLKLAAYRKSSCTWKYFRKFKFSPDLEKLAANMAHDRKRASKQEIYIQVLASVLGSTQ